MMQSIKIIPGITDLSVIPTETLKEIIEVSKVAANQMSETIKDNMEKVEETRKIQSALLEERNRMKDELNSRDSIAIATRLVNEHNLEYCHEPGIITTQITIVKRGEKFYVCVPLPEVNTQWTFIAWEWATTFCRKNRRFYPTHEEWQDCRHIYLLMGAPLE